MTQKELHLSDYFHIIRRRFLVVISFFIILITSVYLGSLKQIPIYQADTTLMIESRSPRIISVQEVNPMGASGGNIDKDYYETQYKLIKSISLLKKVVSTLGIKSEVSNREIDVINKLSRMITVSPIRHSQLVKIIVENSNPQMAAMIANVTADEYIKQNLRRNITGGNRGGGCCCFYRPTFRFYLIYGIGGILWFLLKN